MRAAGYPGLGEHRAEHLAFVARLSALVREHDAGGVAAFLGLRARNWVVVWLLDHVAGTDQAMGRWLLSRGGQQVGESRR